LASWPVGWLATWLGSMRVAVIREVPAVASCVPVEMEKDEHET